MTGNTSIARGVVAAFFSVCAAPAVSHAAQAAAGIDMPMTLNASFEFDCLNAPGPRIAFDGLLTMNGADMALIFRNQRFTGASHDGTEEVDVQVVAGTTGETIVIPKQPVLGGVGGNPWISVQMIDGDGHALTQEFMLGRCVQGVLDMSLPMSAPVTALAFAEALDCTNNPGPLISVEGSMMLDSGIQARFYFRNQRTHKAPHEADAVVDVEVLPEGFTLRFPKQPVLGGVGGNPWIWLQFLDEDGAGLSDEIFIGRCVQLLPGN